MAMPSSTAALSGMVLPPRNWPSEVITALAPASIMRSFRLLAEKPPNTTECTNPKRAQACMATTASMPMGK